MTYTIEPPCTSVNPNMVNDSCMSNLVDNMLPLSSFNLFNGPIKLIRPATNLLIEKALPQDCYSDPTSKTACKK